MSELAGYFRGRMRAANSAVNEARVVAGLRRAGLFSVQASVQLEGKTKKVVVGEERVCGGCHKRLGGSVVAVVPEGMGGGVVHYGCLGKVLKGVTSPVGSVGSVGTWR